jgi:hypothetical protein
MVTVLVLPMFHGYDTKAQTRKAKIKQGELCPTKKLLYSTAVNWMKMQPKEWTKICAKYTSEKALISKIYEKLQ